MHTVTATLLKFDEKGEKTGWTYIAVPVAITEAIRPDQKTSFRVRGLLDAYPLNQVALIPMGDGAFILPVNAGMRHAIRKEAGATVRLTIEFDDSPMPLSAELMLCLDDVPDALAYFQTLAPGHQRYFSNWIDDAKTMATKTKRLTQAVRALSMGMGFGEMIRYFKKTSVRANTTTTGVATTLTAPNPLIPLQTTG